MTRRQRKTLKKIDSPELLLEMAEEEEDLCDALWFARRARRLAPDNMDAERLVAELSAEDEVKLLRRYEQMIAKGDSCMEEQGYMEQQSFGHYWEIPETRPYVRLRFCYCQLLFDMGIYRKAVTEAEELLWLCAEDALDIRELLLHLYALLGKPEKAEELCVEMDKSSPLLLLPMSVLYYREGNLRLARSYLEQMLRCEPEVVAFYTHFAHGLRSEEETDPQPHKWESTSLFTAKMEQMLRMYARLYIDSPAYFLWGCHELLLLQHDALKKEAKNAS